MDRRKRFFSNHAETASLVLNPPPQKGASSVGKMIVGISTLLMVVILVSGLVIWWPRTRKALNNRLKVSCRKGWRRFWYDSHVTLGFYSSLFLLAMALTGLTWSFGWYRSFAYGLFGGNTSKQAQTHGTSLPQKENDARAKKEGKKQTDYTTWDKAIQEVQAKYTGYTSLRIEEKKIQVIQGQQLRRTDTLKFNPKNGEITETTTYAEVPRAQKLKGWLMPSTPEAGEVSIQRYFIFWQLLSEAYFHSAGIIYG